MMRAPKNINVAALIDSAPLGRFHYRVMVLSWLIMMFDGLDQFMLTFTAPYMGESLHLSKQQIGLLGSIGNVGMVVGGIFFSYIADRIGRRPTIIATAIAFGLLTAAISLAPNYHALLWLRFIDGIPIGGLIPLAWTLNIECAPRRLRASIVTIIMVGYSVGVFFAGPLTNLLAPQHGWQAVYLAGGLMTLFCAMLLWIGLPESIRFMTLKGRWPGKLSQAVNQVAPAAASQPDDRFELQDELSTPRHVPYSELFRDRLRFITPLIWFGYFISSFVIYVLSFWSPQIIEALKFPRTTAATVAAAASLLGAGAALVLMRFTDRLGPIAIAACAAAAVPVMVLTGSGLIPHAQFLWVSVAASLLVSAMHFGWQSIAGIYYPSAVRARGAGMASSIAKLGAVAGPYAGSLFLAHLPVLRIYTVLAVGPAVIAICMLAIAAILRAERN